MNGATYEGDILNVADPRMIGLDLTRSEAALLDCLPVVLHGPNSCEALRPWHSWPDRDRGRPLQRASCRGCLLPAQRPV